jgi:hypothetical protein
MAVAGGAAEDAIAAAGDIKEGVEHAIGGAVLPQLGRRLGALEVRLAQERHELRRSHAGQDG